MGHRPDGEGLTRFFWTQKIPGHALGTLVERLVPGTVLNRAWDALVGGPALVVRGPGTFHVEGNQRLEETRGQPEIGDPIFNFKVAHLALVTLDRRVDQTMVPLGERFTLFRPRVQEEAFLALSAGLRIGIDSAVLHFSRDFPTHIFRKVKPTVAFDARILPVVAHAIGHHKLLGHRRAAASEVVKEEPCLAKVAGPGIRIRGRDLAVFHFEFEAFSIGRRPVKTLQVADLAEGITGVIFGAG